jgi:hypothetical protein
MIKRFIGTATRNNHMAKLRERMYVPVVGYAVGFNGLHLMGRGGEDMDFG